jgi:hypothetical protein
LVVARRRGTARICELDAMPLHAVGDRLRDYGASWNEGLRTLKRYIEEER